MFSQKNDSQYGLEITFHREIDACSSLGFLTSVSWVLISSMALSFDALPRSFVSAIQPTKSSGKILVLGYGNGLRFRFGVRGQQIFVVSGDADPVTLNFAFAEHLALFFFALIPPTRVLLTQLAGKLDLLRIG
jgi:hypothetical protein